MKRKFSLYFASVVLIACAVGLFYQFAIADTPNMKIVRRVLILLFIYIAYFIRLNRRRFTFLNGRLYKKTYAPYIEKAFVNDKKSSRILLKAIGLYNTDKCTKATGYLYSIEDKCVTAEDHGAVYFFLALCFDELEMEENTIENYEKLLSYQPYHSMGLSNLGLIYQKKGNYERAAELYRRAIDADPNNAYPHSNLANLFLRMGTPKPALEEAVKAMSLDPDIKAAISAAAISSALLGMDKESEEYCRRYGQHGGNPDELRKIIKGYTS